MSMFRRQGQEDEDEEDSDIETGRQDQMEGAKLNGDTRLEGDREGQGDDASTSANGDHKEANEDEDEDEDGGMGMGALFDQLPDSTSPSTDPTEDSSITRTIRSFPLPKHMPSSLIMPKKLLHELLLGKSGGKLGGVSLTGNTSGNGNGNGVGAGGVGDTQTKGTVTTLSYTDISSGSRAKRSRLEITWSLSPTNQSGFKNSTVKAPALSTGGVTTATTTTTVTQAVKVDPPTQSPATVTQPPADSSIPLVVSSSLTPSPSSSTPAQTATPIPPVPSSPPSEIQQVQPNSLVLIQHTIATNSTLESDNYLATIALHQLMSGLSHSNLVPEFLGLKPTCSLLLPSTPSASSNNDNDDKDSPKQFIPPLYPSINPKLLPLPYRDLWVELEVLKKQADDEKDREVWKKLDGIREERGKVGNGGGSINDDSEKRGVKNRNKEAAVGGGGRSRQSQNSLTTSLGFDQRIQDEWNVRKNSFGYKNMLRQRNSLPVAAYRDSILSTISSNPVTVISADTGAGKSTQLPAYLLESHLEKGLPCKIYVTEPRRISAISLAERVAKELGDLGVNNSGLGNGEGGLVGYSIRLESKIGPKTKLAFVTNGIALRMLESSGNGNGASRKESAFDEITHLCIDEVHERSIETDFLLIIIRSMLKERPGLKVILMSATLNAEKISAYFDGAPILKIPGRTFPVHANYLEDAVQYCGYHITEKSPYALQDLRRRNKQQLEWNEDESAGEDDDPDDNNKTSTPEDPLKLSSAIYSRETVETVNILDPKQIPYELILRLLERLCLEENSIYSQAILVFLPGIAEIKKLNGMLNDHERFGREEDFRLYALHSSISSENQSAVFDVPPHGVRKIVLSSNIAETGVTIPDITCVIDTGKHREMRYDEKRQISRLRETFIARSNAQQRRGRAGRVQEGLAFHLFTKARHDIQLAGHPEPEMLRLSLQDLALRIKILEVKVAPSIAETLAEALDPPSAQNVVRAVNALIEVGALDSTEEITSLGLLLSKMPVDVHLGKFLLFGALFKCLDVCLSIAAVLSSKSPFVTPFGQEHLVDTIKSAFKIENSDFLTLHNVFATWRAASSNTNTSRQFCRKNYLSYQTLQQIEELRQQLYTYLIDTGFVQASSEERTELSKARFHRGNRTVFVPIPAKWNANAEEVHIVGAALLAGLYPKLLYVDSFTGGLRTLTNNQPISIHPSSVNFRTKPTEFGTNYIVYYTIMQSKRLFAWEAGPVLDEAVYLLCGDLIETKLWASTSIIDRKLKFAISPLNALALTTLREKFQSAVSRKLSGKTVDQESETWFEMGLKVLSRPPVEVPDVVTNQIRK